MIIKKKNSTELKTRTNIITVLAIVLPLFMAAIDGTIVSAVLPEITESLGEPSLYPWIMSAFLLPLALIAPFIGALGDRIGIKPMMIISIFVFASASVFAANANTMQMLIFARVIQGGSAGAVIVLCYSLLAVVFSVKERAKMQGMLSSVWGVSAILGPILGGLLSSLFDWRAIFLINIPICLVALFMLLLTPTLKLAKSKNKIDLLTQISFAVLCFTILMMVSSDQIKWLSTERLIIILTIATTIFVYRILKNAKFSPIPVEFIKRPSLISTLVMILVSSATLYSSVTIIPITLSKLGQSTLSLSGLITIVALGWVVGAAFCGSKLVKFGFRNISLIGTILLLIGCLVMIPAIETIMMPLITICLAFIGLGMGFVSTSTLVYVQNSAPKEQLSTWTSTVQFLRNLGAAFGVNVFTMIQLSPDQGFKMSFIILAGIIIVSAFCALALPKSYKLPTIVERY